MYDVEHVKLNSVFVFDGGLQEYLKIRYRKNIIDPEWEIANVKPSIMGNWKLEVGKMFIYMAFPVGIFHVFNQPQLFEEYVLKVKAEMYPPDMVEKGEELRRELDKYFKEKELEELKSAERGG